MLVYALLDHYNNLNMIRITFLFAILIIEISVTYSSYTCKEPECLKFIKCANGIKKDDHGCLTCQCITKHARCWEPLKIGPCEALVPRYFYNRTSQRCESFQWGGCHPNGNNFEDVAVCRDLCEPCPKFICFMACENGRVYNEMGCDVCACIDCTLPKKVGPCTDKKIKYFYNNRTGRCEKFYWGGCLKNGNNFNTKQECERRCMVRKHVNY